MKKRTWHLWFAWHPVRIRHEYVWLEIVWRRWYIISGSGFWDYDN